CAQVVAEEGFGDSDNRDNRSHPRDNRCVKGKSIEINKLNRITALFMLVTTWIVATLNPSILGMIETMGGPIIAMILFLMPMYAIQKVPAMRKYSGHISNVFVVVMGLIAISAIFYSLFS
ncbi:hypothetical protein ACUOFC_16195, partial [Escherichia sp. TWPC-MK]